MAGGVAVTSLGDLIKGTLSNFKKNKWTDLTTNKQSFIAIKYFRDDKKKVSFQGGPNVTWNYQVGTSGSGTHFKPYGTLTPNQNDTMIQASLGWCFFRSHALYNEVEIRLNQANESKLFDLMKTKDNDAQVSLFELMETDMFSYPSTDSQSDAQFAGFPYWLQYNATAGFNGGNASSFAAGPAGVSAVTYPATCNYTDSYVNVSMPDLIEKVKLASWSTDFQSPVTGNPSGMTQSDERVWLTTYGVRAGIEMLVTLQNDNIGRNITEYYNKGLLMGNPLTAVPYMTQDATINAAAPLLGLNFNSFKIAVLEGMDITKREPEKMGPTQPDTWVQRWELGAQLQCYNRRDQILIAKSAPW